MVRGQRCDAGVPVRVRPLVHDIRVQRAVSYTNGRSANGPHRADASPTRSQTPAAGKVPRPRRSISHCRRRRMQPSKRLVGFQKVDLMPGESKQVTVTIDSSASNHPLSYWVPEKTRRCRAGERHLECGSGRLHRPCRDLLCGHPTCPDDSSPARRFSVSFSFADELHDDSARP